MKDQNCGYCMRGELLEQFGIYICDLSVSSLILFKEQSHPRCLPPGQGELRGIWGYRLPPPYASCAEV